MRYFTDRVVQHPGRMKLTPVSGQTNVYDVERQEGTVTEPGTPFNAETFNGIINAAHGFGTCTAGANVADKIVDCPGFQLFTGACVAVRFNNANTSTAATMNVNGTGAKPIRALMNDTAAPVGLWKAGEVVTLVYGGTNWLVVDGGRGQVDQKRVFYGTSSTGASTSAKTASVDSSFVLQTGVTVAVKFSNAAMSSPGYTRTLNVNSTGAKSIIVEGNTTFKYIPWGTNDVVLFVYDGTYWQLLNPSQRVNSPSISISPSVGSLASATVRQSGNIVQLQIGVANSSEVASGSNIFQGTLNTTALLPAAPASGSTYYGSRTIAGMVSPAGNIVVRNSSPTAGTFSATPNINFMYLV